jgi:hypothetical protein
MAENTKTPPYQDQRQRTPQSGADKQQKPGGSVPSSNPDRSRQGQGPGVNPNKPEIDPDRSRQGVSNPKPEIDPDRDRQNRGTGKPMPGKGGEADVDDIDDDDSTQRMERD